MKHTVSASQGSCARDRPAEPTLSGELVSVERNGTHGRVDALGMGVVELCDGQAVAY